MSWDDLKTHSRITLDAEDVAGVSMLQAAREQVELTECWIQLLTATYELRLDAFPSGSIWLPKPPCQAVESIQYLDPAGDLQTFGTYDDSSPAEIVEYVVDAKAQTEPERAEIFLRNGYSWPATLAEQNAVRIRFTCGFGDSPEDVPAGIRQWILIMAGTQYENREREITGTITSELKYVSGLLDPWRAKQQVRT